MQDGTMKKRNRNTKGAFGGKAHRGPTMWKHIKKAIGKKKQ